MFLRGSESRGLPQRQSKELAQLRELPAEARSLRLSSLAQLTHPRWEQLRNLPVALVRVLGTGARSHPCCLQSGPVSRRAALVAPL